MRTLSRLISRSHRAWFLPCLALPALAQIPAPTSAERDTPVTLDVFNVDASRTSGYRASSSISTTRIDTPIGDLPNSIQVMTRDLMDDAGAIQVTDLAKFTSNIAIGDHNRDIFTLRGFGGALPFIDGVQLSSEISRDLSMIERVEVVKGASAVLFGVSQPGGLINMLTKRPLREARENVTLTVGSYDFYRASIDVSAPLSADGRLAYRLIGAYQRNESWREWEYRRRKSISPSVSYELNDRTSFFVGGHFQEDRVRYGGNVPYSSDDGLVRYNLPRGWYRGELDDLVQGSIADARIEIVHRLGREWISRFSGLFSQVDLDQLFTYNTANVALPSGTVTRRQRRYEHPVTIANAQIDLIGRERTGNIEHALLFGAQYNYTDEYRMQRDQATGSINAFAPVYGQLATGPFITTGLPNQDIEARLQGLYFQDQMWFAQRRFALVLGARYDSFSQVTRDHNPTAVRPLLDRSDNRTSPKAALLWKITPSVSLYASYDSSYTPNLGVEPATGTPFKSLIANQKEVGLKFSLQDSRLTGSLAWFETIRKNIIVTNVQVIPFVQEQRGEITADGVELDFNYAFTDSWQLLGSFGVLSNEITKDLNPAFIGRNPTNSPELTAGLWTKHTWMHGSLAGFSLGVGVRYEGEKFADTANIVNVDSSTVFNLLVSYQRKNWRAQVNVENVFDEMWWEATGAPRASATGAPRTFSLTLSRTF